MHQNKLVFLNAYSQSLDDKCCINGTIIGNRTIFGRKDLNSESFYVLDSISKCKFITEQTSEIHEAIEQANQ